MFKRKGLLVMFGVLGVLVALLGAAGAVYAQELQPPTAAGSPRGAAPFCAQGPHSYARRMGGLGFGGAGGYSLVDATAAATGLAETAIVAALEGGQTFAQIAEAQGVDPQAIVDIFLAGREEALREAVAEGRLSQEQAERMLEEMAEHVSEHLDQSWTPRLRGEGWMRKGPVSELPTRFGTGPGRWSAPNG